MPFLPLNVPLYPPKVEGEPATGEIEVPTTETDARAVQDESHQVIPALLETT